MPPLVVATISPVPVMAFPTAKHTLVLTHVTPFRATSSVAGVDCAVQFEPLLEVAMTVATLLVPPTAKQTDALGQFTSFSGVFVPLGADFDVQIEPPFVVAMIVGELPARPPTAMQCVALAHDTPCSAAVTDARWTLRGPGGPPVALSPRSAEPRGRRCPPPRSRCC